MHFSKTSFVFNQSIKMYQLTEAEWHIYVSAIQPSLVQIMALHRTGDKPLSEPPLVQIVAWHRPGDICHYLNQYWNIVTWTIQNKRRWNFNRNTYIFIQGNAFESVVNLMAAILYRLKCIKDRSYLSIFALLVLSVYVYIHGVPSNPWNLQDLPGSIQDQSQYNIATGLPFFTPSTNP